MILLRQIIVFSLISLLAGCAGSDYREYVESSGNPTKWKQHKGQIVRIDGWQIEGKIGINAPKYSGSGLLCWVQRHNYCDIHLSGPLGVGAARLRGRPGQVILEVGRQGPHEADTPEIILEKQIGWKLPISHLTWWVTGLPDPDRKSRLFLNGDSRLSTLDQDGWHIEYLGYVKRSGLWLPERIKLHSPGLDVTIVVKEWKPIVLKQ